MNIGEMVKDAVAKKVARIVTSAEAIAKSGTSMASDLTTDDLASILATVRIIRNDVSDLYGIITAVDELKKSFENKEES